MGGVSDSEQNALTVVPWGRASSNAVTTETGVHTEPIAALKSSAATIVWSVAIRQIYVASIPVSTHALTATSSAV
jgi:hypothetical protein